MSRRKALIAIALCCLSLAGCGTAGSNASSPTTQCETFTCRSERFKTREAQGIQEAGEEAEADRCAQEGKSEAQAMECARHAAHP